MCTCISHIKNVASGFWAMCPDTFVSAIMAYQHSCILGWAFGNGIEAVMADYIHDGHVKEDVVIIVMYNKRVYF